MDTILTGEGPKYQALAQHLRERIARGDLAEGAQLPPVRDLAWEAKVTPGTVARAYRILTQEGLLEATVGRGTFVAARTPRLGPPPPTEAEVDVRPVAGRLDLRSPSLPEVGQVAALGESLRRISMKIDAQWLGYVTQSGESTLRAAVVRWLSDRMLGALPPEDVVLTHGGQSAVSLVLQCVLRGDRPAVLVEDLCYPGFRYAARLARAEVFGVAMDAEGMRPDALEAACRRHMPQVLCLTPDAQNPTTARMSLERRRQIVSIAERYNLQIIEDECYTPRDHDVPTLRAIAPSRVWYVGSLSKTLSAALRFGYLLCPAGMGTAGRLAAQHAYFALSQPVASLVLDLFQSGAAQAIRTRVLEDFTSRSRMAANILGSFDIAWQPGLPFVWMTLAQGWRSSTFARRAEEAGVLLRPSDHYVMVNGHAPNAVRMALAGDVSLARLEEGLRRLAGLMSAPPDDMAV
ncbi:PLP-dependent aminotransferase family protein [Stagnihabitans tardus]|uniref:Aminotransferase class I/II-fold pyridoxal phosphate-dependent enzyme n=1 Tax=Stagnihabitans tardus TaxID=2699202 RepID=A0AAE4Y7S3_9RHOB|nr:PLP-dependent aminotransferase family protein [Stagnihabitans tardus]NBZ87451.1 aminotransferase class I/II-fold pyridoxal phosphate-dependent enzyme [Stagnihabitans tardus]